MRCGKYFAKRRASRWWMTAKPIISPCRWRPAGGVMYRETYEEDRKRGPIERHYCLCDPHVIFNFVALAVLSGIIGNASYDLIKNVLNRLFAQGSKLAKVDSFEFAKLSKLSSNAS